jgi:hypothetical protein
MQALDLIVTDSRNVIASDDRSEAIPCRNKPEHHFLDPVEEIASLKDGLARNDILMDGQ